MDNIIIVVADLGHFKAYKITKDPLESHRVTLIKSYDSVEGRTKLSDKVSDSAGRFKRGGKETAKGHGERHNIEIETESKLIKTISRDINSLIVSEKCNKWYLAAGEKINRQITDKVKPEVKAKLDKNITANLTKIGKSEILNYFQ
jgi:hypothetical protein